MLIVLLLVAALVCFLLAAFSAAIGRVAPGWLGLAILAVVQLIAAI
ncbi:MAG: hypothetical protein ABR549_15640 [Mycobacteriales bacterium]